jgi:carbamoyl-phosphate synthase large subunit
MEQRDEYRVIVTGVGALIGQGVAQGLKEGGRAWVLGIDRRESLYAEALCDQIVLKPDCDEDDPRYLAFWVDLIKAHKIGLIIPGISIDVAFLAKNRAALETVGAKIVLNESRLVKLTEDKLKFADDFAGLGLATIPTVTGGANWEDACGALGQPPFIFKPAIGEGSVGIHLLTDQMDFDYWTKRNENAYLIQKVIGTNEAEFTVGIFGLGAGKYIGPLIFKRKLTRAGNTGEAEAVEQPEISRVTKLIAEHYEPIGPTNLQFRMEGGRAYLLEINARFSSSASLRRLFGFDEANMCLDFFLEGKTPAEPILRRGYAQRHSADMVKYARSSV